MIEALEPRRQRLVRLLHLAHRLAVAAAVLLNKEDLVQIVSQLTTIEGTQDLNMVVETATAELPLNLLLHNRTMVQDSTTIRQRRRESRQQMTISSFNTNDN